MPTLLDVIGTTALGEIGGLPTTGTGGSNQADGIAALNTVFPNAPQVDLQSVIGVSISGTPTPSMPSFIPLTGFTDDGAGTQALKFTAVVGSLTYAVAYRGILSATWIASVQDSTNSENNAAWENATAPASNPSGSYSPSAWQATVPTGSLTVALVYSPAVVTDASIQDDAAAALRNAGLAGAGTATVTAATNAASFTVDGLPSGWTGPLVAISGTNAGWAGNVSGNAAGLLTVSGLIATPAPGDTFAAVNLATAKAVAAIPTTPLLASDARLPSTTIAAQSDVSGIPAAMWSNTQRTLTGTGGAIGPTAGANLGPIAFGPVVPGQTLDLSACVSINGQYITAEETSLIAYTITDCDSGLPVPGHIGVALVPATPYIGAPGTCCLSDTILTDAEASNYNFRFRPSLASKSPFPECGRYAVAVTFTVGGQPYFANFRGEARY